ncbi:MAG: hypothetical protein R3F07_16010 [Opitutaceae bacterium]
MKTTLDISDNLLLRAKALARRRGTTLRSLTEQGLTRILDEEPNQTSAKIQPVTFRGRGLSPEFEGAGWQRIRDAAYEEC